MRALLLFALLLFVAVAKGQSQTKVLIYTHNGKGYVHENISSSVTALTKLCKEAGYEPFHTDDPAHFTTDNLKSYQAIIFSNTNNEAFETQEQKDAFQKFIQNGGGFMGIHSASGSERQWPWFWAMLGGKFVRHPKYQPFTIKVIDPEHPATEFLNGDWQWEDECYYLNQLNPDIHVLLAADMSTIDDEKKGEYPGETFGSLFPLVWCHEYDGGRQFYTALGHNSKHYSDPTYLKHLSGGLAWILKEN